MIDHFNLPVLDLDRSRRFYAQVLVPLGLRFLAQDGDAVGFGNESWTFGIVVASGPLPKLHVAFQARTRGMVDGFYQAALVAGAVPNGSPDLRPQYDPEYYAAFVLDPDGHNIEAVCRKEGAA